MAKSKKKSSGSGRSWVQKLKQFAWKMDGSERGRVLEETGLIESYEKAVTMNNPPSKFYPGNVYYSYYFGLMPEFMPPILVNNLANWMMRKLVGI